MANLSGIAAGHTLSGLSINPLTGAMFLSSTNVSESNLYTIDPATGVATLVGATGIGGIIDIAFDPLGMLFATDVNRDALFGLDPLTGASTFIGALGINLNFAQPPRAQRPRSSPSTRRWRSQSLAVRSPSPSRARWRCWASALQGWA